LTLCSGKRSNLTRNGAGLLEAKHQPQQLLARHRSTVTRFGVENLRRVFREQVLASSVVAWKAPAGRNVWTATFVSALVLSMLPMTSVLPDPESCNAIFQKLSMLLREVNNVS
jgi:hypothetical protein